MVVVVAAAAAAAAAAVVVVVVVIAIDDNEENVQHRADRLHLLTYFLAIFVARYWILYRLNIRDLYFCSLPQNGMVSVCTASTGPVAAIIALHSLVSVDIEYQK